MAGSDDEVAAAPKAEVKRITKGIQDAVKQHFQESDAESLTVNNIRSRAEVTLKLGKDFLRTDPYWRNESKTIIREEFVRIFLQLGVLSDLMCSVGETKRCNRRGHKSSSTPKERCTKEKESSWETKGRRAGSLRRISAFEKTFRTPSRRTKGRTSKEGCHARRG